MRLTARILSALLLASALVVVRLDSQSAPPPFSFAEPGISPDGSEIAFASGGDIWSVPASGGDARLLVAHEATERRPLFSPDGRHLAFMSTRTGGGDLYVLTLGTGDVRRLTWDDGSEQLESWSRDSRWLYFSSMTTRMPWRSDSSRMSAMPSIFFSRTSSAIFSTIAALFT